MGPGKSTTPAAGCERFAVRYKTRTGSAPTPVAAATFDCVRLLARAIDVVGPNRARVRDELAQGVPYYGATGESAFDPAGNLTEVWIIRPYQGRKVGARSQRKHTGM